MKSDCLYPYLSCLTEATFGFSPTYSVSEDVGNMTVAVSQQSGILARNLIVSLRTLDGTAVGKSECLVMTGHLHTHVYTHVVKVK